MLAGSSSLPGQGGDDVNSLSAWVEVDLDSFASNLRLIRRLIGPKVRVHLVVKADAYGHGVTRVARVAQEEGVHSLGVATVDEGADEGMTLRARLPPPVSSISIGVSGRIPAEQIGWPAGRSNFPHTISTSLTYVMSAIFFG